jgi:hypothetical protein
MNYLFNLYSKQKLCLFNYSFLTTELFEVRYEGLLHPRPESVSKPP